MAIATKSLALWPRESPGRPGEKKQARPTGVMYAMYTNGRQLHANIYDIYIYIYLFMSVFIYLFLFKTIYVLTK